MAWSINGNFVPEVWEDVRANLGDWSRDQLVEALSDDAFEAASDEPGEALAAADAMREAVSFADHDSLVDAVLELIERTDTCDNGGHRFWIDREGFHSVSTTR